MTRADESAYALLNAAGKVESDAGRR